MVELTNSAIKRAIERGHITQQTEPRADAVHYDKRNSRIIVDLTNGCTFAFPPRLVQGLETAADENLAAVEILGAGYGLHWEALDVDLSIPGLMAGLFGTKAYMARRAGQTKSPAKAAAARENGRKGGRPRKQG
ncbi:hypothetical protein A3731_41145 [Roseovarius sp. HI0049]|nr:hypothetical protein A3731_41145 [Roseovarius sp. HI0049]